MTTHVRLRDVARVFAGTVPAKTDDTPGQPEFFGIAEISAEGAAPLRYVEEGTNLDKAVFLETGDVVIALLGDVGHAALVDDEHSGAVLGRECAALRVNDSTILRPIWLYAWARSAVFKSLAQAMATGATMPRIRTRAIEEFEVPLPPLRQQDKLADLMAHFDSAISTTSGALFELHELRRIEIERAVLEASDALPDRDDHGNTRSEEQRS